MKIYFKYCRANFALKCTFLQVFISKFFLIVKKVIYYLWKKKHFGKNNIKLRRFLRMVKLMINDQKILTLFFAFYCLKFS